MSSQKMPGGVVHELPADLREALNAKATALAAWNDITPLARNELLAGMQAPGAHRKDVGTSRGLRLRHGTTFGSGGLPIDGRREE